MTHDDEWAARRLLLILMANDGEVVYIGSACSWCPNPNQRWLRIRVRHYTCGRQKNTKKIVAEHQINPLLFQCWTTAIESDALKYEYDALRRYNPRLNVLGVSRRTLGEYKEAKRESGLRTQARYASLDDYDPTRTYICSACGEEKEHRLFPKNKYKKYGILKICRKCKNKRCCERKIQVSS